MSTGNDEKKKEYPYHRRFVRHSVRLQINVKAGENYDTWTENISRGGICFDIPRKIEEGETVNLSIRLRTKPVGLVQCKCKIVWNEQDGAKCRHGGQFTSFEGQGLEHLQTYLKKY